MKELKDKIELKLMPVDFKDCAISKHRERPLINALAREAGMPFKTTNIVPYGAMRYWENGKCTTFIFDNEWKITEADYAIANYVNFRGKEPIRTIVLNRVK